MATGEVVPDFGVYGIFDVLYELGSGGSGQTYLCRCDAAASVSRLDSVAYVSVNGKTGLRGRITAAE